MPQVEGRALGYEQRSVLIATLRSINDDRLTDRANVLLMARDDSDDDVDSPAPIYHSYLDSDPESVRTMTNFGPAEFERLWTLMCDHVTMNWNTGRVNKCSYTAKDVLFMLLTVQKNCGTWDIVAAVFRVKPPSFQKVAAKFAWVVSPFLYERLVTSALDKFPMKKMVLSGQVFSKYPYARYASDVTFEQSDMPSGRMQERTLYYSKKHHLHGYSVEAEADAKIEGGDQLIAQYPSRWAILADKGYQDLAHDFRAITPHKRAPLQQLTLEQVATNERIAHDRVVVENYFGVCAHCGQSVPTSTDGMSTATTSTSKHVWP
ncbi:unnamed protein product [Phytophthora fragariaefolia]|uniref:Unnamed protein product n=1 Tax=Phytophthora fragariaefolia TaxID=1490495 RepID=A0A9W7D9N3_9STRA|nr:unnamed protein product [Phytophthora fragariaefolia]